MLSETQFAKITSCIAETKMTLSAEKVKRQLDVKPGL